MRIRIKKKIVKKTVEKLLQLMEQQNPYAHLIFSEMFACGGNKDAELRVIRKWKRAFKKARKAFLGVVS